MTVIAWDGKTLAADKQGGNEWTKYGTTTKIRRIRGHLVGCAGTSSLARAMLAWFEAGAVEADFPEAQSDTDKACTVLVITPDGRCTVYQSTPQPIEYENSYYAIGSGQDAAAAVMELGHDARTAVEIASRVCVGCGNGIDTLELHGQA